MKSIQIGVLLPISSILPIAKDFEKGLKDGLASISKEDYEIEITKELIGQGGTTSAETAINKLLNYDSVELITGILSNKVVGNICSKFQNNSFPFLFNNLGEHVPDISIKNNHIFYNSIHLWRHAWALGNWGVKTFGKKGMFLSAVYDAGYSFSQMFHLGMMHADPNSEWSFSVLPMPAQGQLSDMSILFHFLEQYQPDFVFATFCGAENTLFLNEFINRGWHKKTKLLGLPYLIFPFETLNDNITIYTTSLMGKDIDNNVSNAFYLMGCQTGNIILQALDSEGQTLKQKLKNLSHSILFNETIFLNCHQNIGDSVLIIKNEILAGEKKIHQSSYEETQLFPLNHNAILDLTKETSVTWLNPYLCI